MKRLYVQIPPTTIAPIWARCAAALVHDSRLLPRAAITALSLRAMADVMTLYRAPFSTNVERVALALAHKGLDVESVVISYDDRSPVIEVSGQPLVPVLVDGDEVIADSVQILRHLEERWPDPPLFPRDAARRTELDVFLEWRSEERRVGEE